MKNMKKVMIMAGGTGGHVFPGIAIANAFKKKDIDVCWLGSKDGMEANLVPKHNIPIDFISVSGVRGKGLLTKLKFPFLLFNSILQAMRIIKQQKPDVIISMGGFVAGPGGLAAKLLHIPLIIHEQNSIPGMTNKFLSKIAQQVFCAFPNTFSNGIVVGNPVRDDIENLQKTIKNNTKLNLLILGGSRGAKILNETVPEAIKLLNYPVEIFHQTGETGKADYGNIFATVSPFIDNMAEIYQWADLVICRAGALTLAELTSVGLPAILIPYPHAVDDHQTQNAKYLEKNGAAILLPQSKLNPQKLADILNDLIDHPEKREKMATSSRALRQENVAEKMVEMISVFETR